MSWFGLLVFLVDGVLKFQTLVDYFGSIDNNLINGVVEQAKQSPRLRMNYNFHESLNEKCHREEL